MSCYNLTEVVFLGETITEIKEWLFLNCRSLQRVRLPDVVSTFNDKAFEGCPADVALEYTDGPLAQALIELYPHRNWVKVE